MDPARLSSPTTVVCSRRIVEDAEILPSLRVSAAAFAVPLQEFALLCHCSSVPYLGRGDTPRGIWLDQFVVHVATSRYTLALLTTYFQ
jgi:hypothetical protein